MISDQELKAMEKYVFSDKKIEEALLMLQPGTDIYNMLKVMHFLNIGGVDLIDKDKSLSEIAKSVQSSTYGFSRIMISLRYCFKKLEKTQDPEERDKIIEKIRQQCNCTLNHTRPYNLKKIKKVEKGISEVDNQIQDGVSSEGDDSTYLTVFDYPKYFNDDTLYKDLTVSYSRMNDIHERYYPKINYKKLNTKEMPDKFDQFFGNTLTTVDFRTPSFDKELSKMINKEQSHYVNQLCDKFGLKDLIQLQSEHSACRNTNFSVQMVQKMFYKEFLEYRFRLLSNDQKREVLLEIQKFLNKNLTQGLMSKLLNSELSAFEKTVRYYMIYLNYTENIFDVPLFCKWVDSPNVHVPGMIQSNFQHYGADYILSGLDPEFQSTALPAKIMNAYLKHMVLQKVDIVKKFHKKIDENYLKQLQANVQYRYGLPQDPKYTFNIPSETTNLELSYFNKKQFSVKEEIVLTLEIINVPKLLVKVFEINTENYYRKNMSTFASDINLDGLIAKYEKQHDYSSIGAHIEHQEVFKFAQFNGKRGLYVFEFTGNGISSRAIIQKGNLSLIHRDTIAGHFAFVIDEDKNVCKGPHTGLFFDNNFYKADESNGRIVIPFGRQSYSGSAIVSHDGFAEFTSFAREQEVYQFSSSIVMHDESIVMGNIAKVIIRPFLTLNSREKADLRLLEGTQITIQTVNSIDNITTSKVYEDVKLTEQEDYELEFQVPPNITKVNVILNTQVNVISQQEKHTFTQDKSFEISHHQSDFVFCEVYLRNVGGNYEYIVKGKNGESKAHVPVNFVFSHAYSTSKQSVTLQTDKDGVIHLGRLKHITQIEATPLNSRIIQSTLRTWNLPKFNQVQYPSNELSVHESETIKLPFMHKKVKNTNLSLLQVSTIGKYIENRFANVQLEVNPNNKFGINNIIIQGLKEGKYLLKLKKENVIVSIVVHEGVIWDLSSDFIIKQRQMVQKTNTKADSIRIDDVKIQNIQIEEEKGNKKTVNKVNINLGGNFEIQNTRIHVWAFKFFPNDLEAQLTSPFSCKKLLQHPIKQFNFAVWKNFYLNNRQMSDENRYIFERQSQEKVVGNYLEKPTVLLKRNFIKDTTFTQESLAEGSKYEKHQAEASFANYSQPVADKFAYQNQQKSRKYDKQDKTSFKGINGFQNFLAHSAEFVANIKLQETNQGSTTAEFQAFLEPYSTLLLVAVSEDQYCYSLVPLPIPTIPQRDLSLANPYDSDKTFSETRRTTACLKYETCEIEDITSTDMQIIDSIPKVAMVLKELKKVSATEQEFLDVMIKWNTLSDNQKKKKYSEYCCHELNFFLKMRDTKFFDQVVKPFLSSKMEKTFVDYWLLDITAALNKFDSVQKVQTLNAFEQCLLIEHLVRSGNEKRASEIAQGLAERTVEPSSDIIGRIYDIVLNMNSLNSKPGGGDDIQQEILNMKKKKLEELKDRKNMNVSIDNCLDEDEDEFDENEEEHEDQGWSQNRVVIEDYSLKSIANIRKLSPQRQNKQQFDSADFFAPPKYEELNTIRKTQKVTFKELENTKEYAETNYYKVKFRNESQTLINDGCFWRDLAQHLIQNKSFKGFLSATFTQANSNINEIALVFGTQDLPLKEESHGFKASSGRGVQIKAASNILMFLKEIQVAESKINKDLLVVQRYFEKQKQDKEVEEFLVNEVYACQVIITNISNQNIQFQALTQIPEGSLPLNQSHYQKSYNHSLSAFTTMQFKYYFYFPKVGTYTHFPTNVSIKRVVVAKAAKTKLVVKRVQNKVNQEDFEDILATGSIPDILIFMRTKNIVAPETGSNFKFSDIYWLCTDITFYTEGIKILKSKNIFDPVFWAYSIHHKDEATMKEYFQAQQVDLARKIGPSFNSKLMSVNDEEESDNVQYFLDYFPFVNARAHRMGGMDATSSSGTTATKRWILNNELRSVYMLFMVNLAIKENIGHHDRLQLVNYLLMQERTTEAIQQFKKIPVNFTSKFGEARIQFDYIRAYLDFYICGQSGSFEFNDARAVLNQYENYPVHHWNNLFKEMRDQLKEIDSIHSSNKEKSSLDDDAQGENEEEEKVIDNFEDTEKGVKRKVVKMEPQMDFVIEESTVHIDYVNIDSVRVNYYIVDLEILFSKTPFLSSNNQDFSFVQPYLTEELQLDIKSTNYKFNINEQLAKKNLLIEITNLKNGIKVLKSYYSAQLRVRVIENYGELKVFIPDATSGQDIPLPKTYVKVYQQAKGSGDVKFFKDGYTDLRGRFDYAQLSGTSISEVEKFAVFVSNEEYGSLTKEVIKPSGSKN